MTFKKMGTPKSGNPDGGIEKKRLRKLNRCVLCNAAGLGRYSIPKSKRLNKSACGILKTMKPTKSHRMKIE